MPRLLVADGISTSDSMKGGVVHRWRNDLTGFSGLTCFHLWAKPVAFRDGSMSVLLVMKRELPRGLAYFNCGPRNQNGTKNNTKTSVARW